MKSLTDHLAQYAAYHRDRRNIATHFVGIPMIVLALAILLARPSFTLGITLAPVDILFTLAAIFYLRLSLGFGIAMMLFMLPMAWIGHAVAQFDTGIWLAWGIGLFVVGWVFQFVGHYYEKRKPAFVDDLTGLIIGPLFVVAEAGFMLGLTPQLREAIEVRVGPTLLRS